MGQNGMVEIRDFKVNVLPLKGFPNSRYYVPNGNGTDVDEFITDKSGNYHKVNPTSSSTINKLQSTIILGEDIGGGILIYIGSDGKGYKYNNLNTSNYGKSLAFTNQAGVTDEEVNIIYQGECSQLGSLNTGDLYYASLNGLITNIPPDIGVFQPVGISKNSTTIIINFQKPYIKI